MVFWTLDDLFFFFFASLHKRNRSRVDIFRGIYGLGKFLLMLSSNLLVFAMHNKIAFGKKLWQWTELIHCITKWATQTTITTTIRVFLSNQNLKCEEKDERKNAKRLNSHLFKTQTEKIRPFIFFSMLPCCV